MIMRARFIERGWRRVRLIDGHEENVILSRNDAVEVPRPAVILSGEARNEPRSRKIPIKFEGVMLDREPALNSHLQ
jgi:hypothetical protein